MAFIQQWGTISKDENGDIYLDGFTTNLQGEVINDADDAGKIIIRLIIQELEKWLEKFELSNPASFKDMTGKIETFTWNILENCQLIVEKFRHPDFKGKSKMSILKVCTYILPISAMQSWPLFLSTEITCMRHKENMLRPPSRAMTNGLPLSYIF